ncbi:helix-turn-helix domain-containing protein [Georgenia sp. M64]|uniref:helix-turn-helix domain-containing protein n=1 Tax=Georgenia sp. M64 TaxID=3120520 RepID=UPI0030E5C420
MSDLLTLAEAAEVLRVPEATLRYWRHMGTGPSSARIGRRVVYDRERLQRWVDEQFAAGPSRETTKATA